MKQEAFNVGKADPWMDYDKGVSFTITKISEQYIFLTESKNILIWLKVMLNLILIIIGNIL